MARSGAWQSACVHTRPGLSLIGRLSVHTSHQRATVPHSPLLLIPLRGHGLSENRRAQPFCLLPRSFSFLLFLSSFAFLFSPLCFCFFGLPFPLCSFLSHRFLLLFADSVTRNSGIVIAPSGTGSFTREWSICRATRSELSLFAVLLAGVARELFNLLPCCSFEDVFWD